MGALEAMQATAVERGKREIELTDEIRMEIIFERLCMSRGFTRASEKVDRMKASVFAKMQAAGFIVEGWAG